MQTSELIERLEQATGADRELDAAIYGALVLLQTPEGHKWLDWTVDREAYPLMHADGTPTNLDMVAAPAYTASIDAALTLGPEGWSYVIASPGVDENHPNEWCINMARHPDDEGMLTFAPTPALAICIASLRARNEGEGA